MGMEERAIAGYVSRESQPKGQTNQRASRESHWGTPSILSALAEGMTVQRCRFPQALVCQCML